MTIIKNPIQYTSRTFNSILNDINSDSELRDTPEAWKRLIAGSHDVLSMYTNAIANQSFLRTAFTRQAVSDLLALIDYQLSPQKTSFGTLLFYFNPDIVAFPKTINVGDAVAMSKGDILVSSLRFESRSDVDATAFSENFTTDFATDNNLDVARSYLTGEKVRVDSTGTLPAPLSVNTDYYVTKVSDTEIKLALSVEDAYKDVEIVLTNDGSGVHTIYLYSVQATCYQQKSISSYIIGKSDGVTSWQKFDLQDLNVLEDTVEVIINSEIWTKVDGLIDSVSTDKHFLLRHNTDNSSFIIFGNNTYGAIPANFDINVSYAVGGGIGSNVLVLNKIDIYAGSDSDVVGVSNASLFEEGSEVESMEFAKILAPMLLKTRDRFVTSSDGVALLLAYEGVERVAVIKNFYGTLSCKVPIVPSGGGFPDSSLKTDTQEFLIERSILQEMDVRVEDPVYVEITPIVQSKMNSGYTFEDEKDMIMLSFAILFSEVTYEYKINYLQNGIESTVTLINNKWGFSFGSDDYNQIETLLINITPTDFGKTFQESDIFSSVVPFVNSLDYIIVPSPSFPIIIEEGEISTENIVDGNFTEIT